MKKRLLSLAIAICMVAAMLPTMVLSAGAEGETYNKFVYQFQAYLYGQPHPTNWVANSIPQVDYSDLNGRITYNRSSGVTTATAQGASRLDITCSVGSWIAFDIIVPVADTYNVKFEGTYNRTYGLAGEVYILPGGTDLSDVEGTKASWADKRITSDLSVNAAYTQDATTLDYGWSALAASGKLNGVELSAGVNTVLMYAVGESKYSGATSKNTLMTPVSLTLTSSDAPTDATYTSAYAGAVEVDKQEIALGETATAKAYVDKVPNNPVTTSDTYVPTSISDYSFQSLNTDVATVDSQRGVITPVAPGKTTISAVYTGSECTTGYILSTEVEVYKKSQFAYEFGSNSGALGYDSKSLANAPIADITYGDTAGLWKYYAGHTGSSYILKGGNMQIATSEAHPWLALKINVPESGLYNLYSIAYKHNSGGKGGAYLLKATPEHEKYIEDENIIGALADEDTVTVYKDLDYSNFTTDTNHNVVLTNNIAAANVPLEAGEYILIFNAFEAGAGGGWYQTPGRLFMIEARAKQTGDTYASVQTSAVVLDKYSVEAGKNANAMVNKRAGYSVYSPYRSVSYSNYPLTQLTNGVIYKSSDTNVATVNATTGAITAKNAGTTVITATLADDTEAIGATLTVTAPEPDEELTAAFNLDDIDDEYPYTAPSVVGLTLNGQMIEASPNADGSYNLTAPEMKDGVAFLYWTMGMTENKRIVSFSETLENYVPEGDFVNYLIPVYDGDVDTGVAEYYNINGQRIATGSAPDYPSIPGLGTAYDWDPCGDNIYVAKYADTTPEATITITKGDNCSLNKNDKYAYGENVVCTATGTGTFKCWMKNDEIVSVDETYTFYAWEDCTVEAVYEDHYYKGNMMKILIDSFDVDEDVTGVMAEFINIDAVEKGIMFTDEETNETTKIAMTTTENQFTVIADKPGTYVGYAILASGTPYTLITDGSITINN